MKMRVKQKPASASAMLDDTPEPMAAASTPAPLISPRRHQIYHRGRRIWPLRHWICTAQHRLVAIVCAVPDTAKGPTAIRNGPLSTWIHALRARGAARAGCDAAAVASSARPFLAGLMAPLVCSANANRLTDAVEERERLAGPP